MNAWAKGVLAVLVFQCALGACAFAGDSGADVRAAFEAANRLYEAGKYREAAAAYEGILSGGFNSAPLYYNLGNAHYHGGRVGKAVWAYERAFILDPRNEDIRWNLDLVKKNLKDREEPKKEIVPIILARKNLAYLKNDEIAWAFAACTALLTLLLLGAAFLPRQRALLRKLIFPVLVAGAVAGGMVWLRWTEISHPVGIVVDQEVFVRYAPDADKTRMFALHEGSRVRILRETGGWFLVEFAGHKEGFLPAKSVLKVWS